MTVPPSLQALPEAILVGTVPWQRGVLLGDHELRLVSCRNPFYTKCLGAVTTEPHDIQGSEQSIVSKYRNQLRSIGTNYGNPMIAMVPEFHCCGPLGKNSPDHETAAMPTLLTTIYTPPTDVPGKPSGL